MLIDLSQPRKKYFRRWTARDVLLQYMHKARFLPKHLRELDNVVVGTAEESLDDLLDGKSYHLDHFASVSKIKSLGRDELLVLPAAYRIPADESRRFIAYRMRALVNLNRYRAPGRDIEEVYQTAFDHLHQNRDYYIKRTGLGCYWSGEMDGLMRVVMLINNIEGQELRAFQNLAWYKLEFPDFEEEVKKEGDERKLRRCRKYRKHLASPRREGKILQHYVDQLKVRERDLIEVTSPEKSLIINFSVPSRTNIYREHDVTVSNVPILKSGSEKITSGVWDIYGECPCKDNKFRSDRHTPAKEFYFDPHIIASLRGLKAMQEAEGKSKRIHSLPFIIPRKSLVDYVDKLRYRTIMLEMNLETGKMRMRSLNETEIGALAMKKMVADPFHQNATTDYHVFRKQKYDPSLDLIKFRT